ncbi:MAG TPA: MBOAT family protein [Anaerolineae bacterium]|nr:MBOAT family protein [Anaerolineae bacterium]
MLFNSLEFLIFFPIVVGLYFACPYRWRWALLLAASYYFYAAWKLEYLVLILISTVVDYTVALAIARQTQPGVRTRLLAVSLTINLGLLFTFKYFNFFNDSLRALFNQFNLFYDVPAFQLLLPVGISFYTFQALSYTIDVYRGKLEPERHFGRFALFISFFPQLVAGPIERARHMLPQFRQDFDFSGERLISGLRLILWGLFKKIVIADRLGLYVNAVYNNPAEYQGWTVALATFFFAFQIYCDFSAYSDIAIGSARVMGFELMENFRRPYFATSPVDFWRRWHISLSTWFRDYVYIPLGGNRVSVERWYANLLIVFLVSGLWHGANWTFVIWGALHGLYVVGEVASTGLRRRLAHSLQLDRRPQVQAVLAGVFTFVLVWLAWLFFRANSVSDAFLLLGNLFQPSELNAIYSPWAGVVANPGLELALAVGLIGLLLLVEWLQARAWQLPVLTPQPRWLRWAAYLFLALAIMNLGITEEVPFIYFQF